MIDLLEESYGDVLDSNCLLVANLPSVNREIPT